MDGPGRLDYSRGVLPGPPSHGPAHIGEIAWI